MSEKRFRIHKHVNIMSPHVIRFEQEKKKLRRSPNETALTNIVEARMKIIRDALPNRIISFLTMCCPTKAAIVATRMK